MKIHPKEDPNKNIIEKIEWLRTKGRGNFILLSPKQFIEFNSLKTYYPILISELYKEKIEVVCSKTEDEGPNMGPVFCNIFYPDWMCDCHAVRTPKDTPNE